MRWWCWHRWTKWVDSTHVAHSVLGRHEQATQERRCTKCRKLRVRAVHMEG